MYLYIIKQTLIHTAMKKYSQRKEVAAKNDSPFEGQTIRLFVADKNGTMTLDEVFGKYGFTAWCFESNEALNKYMEERTA